MKALSICHKRRQNDAAFTFFKKIFSEFFWLFLYGFYHFLDNIATSWEWSKVRLELRLDNCSF